MADIRAMADRSAAEAAHAREELRKIRSSMESFERDRDKYEGLVRLLIDWLYLFRFEMKMYFVYCSHSLRLYSTVNTVFLFLR